MSDSYITKQCQENEHLVLMQVFPPKQWISKLSIVFKPTPSITQRVHSVWSDSETPAVFWVFNTTYWYLANITVLVLYVALRGRIIK